MAFEEIGPARAAAERFQADRARAGVAVGKDRIHHRRSNQIEERLAQAVAGGARARTGQGLQPTAPELACDEALQATSANW